MLQFYLYRNDFGQILVFEKKQENMICLECGFPALIYANNIEELKFKLKKYHLDISNIMLFRKTREDDCHIKWWYSLSKLHKIKMIAYSELIGKHPNHVTEDEMLYLHKNHIRMMPSHDYFIGMFVDEFNNL